MNSAELANLMREDLKAFKKKPFIERKEIAKKNLISSGLINKNGEYTDHYKYTKEYYSSKAN